MPNPAPAPHCLAAKLMAEVARQSRQGGALGPAFEVRDLHEVMITGPIDLLALARVAIEAAQ